MGWWDKEINDGAGALSAALHHPVRQGQGIALSDTEAAAKEKEHRTSEDLESNIDIGSIKLKLGKLSVDRPSAGAHHQCYMGGETITVPKQCVCSVVNFWESRNLPTRIRYCAA